MCLLRQDGWHEVRHRFDYCFSKSGLGVIYAPTYSLTVLETTEVYVSVHQKDQRALDAPIHMGIGVTVFRCMPGGQNEFVGSSKGNGDRMCQVDLVSLPAGSYIIVPYSTGERIMQRIAELKGLGADCQSQDYDADFRREASVVVHSSSKKIEVKEMPFDADIHAEALKMSVIKTGESDLLTNDVTLFKKNFGMAGMTYCVQNDTKKDFTITMNFADSENLVTHYGDKKNTSELKCVISPGQSSFVNFVSPEKSNQSGEFSIVNSMKMSIGGNCDLLHEKVAQDKATAATETAVEITRRSSMIARPVPRPQRYSSMFSLPPPEKKIAQPLPLPPVSSPPPPPPPIVLPQVPPPPPPLSASPVPPPLPYIVPPPPPPTAPPAPCIPPPPSPKIVKVDLRSTQSTPLPPPKEVKQDTGSKKESSTGGKIWNIFTCKCIRG